MEAEMLKQRLEHSLGLGCGVVEFLAPQCVVTLILHEYQRLSSERHGIKSSSRLQHGISVSNVITV